MCLVAAVGMLSCLVLPFLVDTANKFEIQPVKMLPFFIFSFFLSCFLMKETKLN